MTTPPSHNPERLFHVAGAGIAGAPHIWSYAATVDDEYLWQLSGFFDGQELMRPGDWLLVSIKVGDRHHGAMRIVARTRPHVELAAIDGSDAGERSARALIG